jgi:hypothetical protein
MLLRAGSLGEKARTGDWDKLSQGLAWVWHVISNLLQTG